MSSTDSKMIRHFSDIDLGFNLNPITKDIARKVDVQAIKQSLKNLVLSHFYDVPFHPEIGSQLYSLLFDNFTPAIKIALERAIQTTIENFEPRVSLRQVSITESRDANALSVTLYYNIVNTEKPQTYQFTINRTR